MQVADIRSGKTECCPPAEESAGFKDAAALVSLFKAMGDETRLEMLSLMVDAGEPLCACHIESHFSLSQPTISHHLRVLKLAGVVTAERRGTWMYYSILPSVRTQLAALVSALPKRSSTKSANRVCT